MAGNHPDWYLRESAAEFGACFQATDKRFKSLGVTRKKTFTYSEKSEAKREEFLTKAGRIPQENPVYADESGIAV